MSNSTTSSTTTLRANSDYTNNSSPPRLASRRYNFQETDKTEAPTIYESPPTRARTALSNDNHIHMPVARYQDLPHPGSPRRKRASTITDRTSPSNIILHNRTKPQEHEYKFSPKGRSSSMLSNAYLEDKPPENRRRSDITETLGSGSRASVSARKSGVWEELEMVKERLYRLKVSGNGMSRSNTLTSLSSPPHTVPHRLASRQHDYDTLQEEDGLRQENNGISPSISSHALDQTPNYPNRDRTQAETHLRDVLERAKRVRDNISLVLIERAALDLLKVYDTTDDKQVIEGLDCASISLASFILQTLDSAASTNAARPETPNTRESVGSQFSPQNPLSGSRQSFRARPYLGPSSAFRMPRASSTIGFSSDDSHELSRGGGLGSLYAGEGTKVSTPNSFANDNLHSHSQPLPRTTSSLSRTTSFRSSLGHELNDTPSKIGYINKEKGLGLTNSFSTRSVGTPTPSLPTSNARHHVDGRRTHNTFYGSTGGDLQDRLWPSGSVERPSLGQNKTTREENRRKRHSLTFI